MRKASNRKAITIALVLAAVASSGIGVALAEDCPPHPHPCGNEWPAGLEGPFELREVRRVQVESHDGVLLDGWLSFPDLPPGVLAPVILVSSPYYSKCPIVQGPICLRNPEADGWFDEGEMQFDQWFDGFGLFPISWIRRGFVLANFSVRGTGRSGGCFELGGRNEQLDQRALVDWLASQMWSNGRVGMGGLSYAGWTAWQAAVRLAPHCFVRGHPAELRFTGGCIRVIPTHWVGGGTDAAPASACHDSGKRRP